MRGGGEHLQNIQRTLEPETGPSSTNAGTGDGSPSGLGTCKPGLVRGDAVLVADGRRD